MATALPIALEAAGDVMEKYGFKADPMGAMMMVAAIRVHVDADPAVKEQVEVLQNKLMGKV